MVGESIIRSATEAEKKDYVEIGNTMTYEQQFRKELAAKEQEMTKLHKPFDRVGAIHDFEDKKAEVLKRYQRNYGEGAPNYIKIEELKIDLNEYSKMDRFKLLDVADNVEMKLMDGVRVPVVTGKQFNYGYTKHHLGTGHCNVFVPNEELRKIDDIDKSQMKK